MAATKFLFVTQPNIVVQGCTIEGGRESTYDLMGVASPFNGLQAYPGLVVANVDANGVLVSTDTSVPTIAIGTNPTSGSVISGTLVGVPVGGLSFFTDLAITLGGNGYTLTASGSLTTATSNAFNVTSVKRVTPAVMSGTITANGQYVGPYRFRGHALDRQQDSQIVAITGTFSGTITVITVPPGYDQTLAANQSVALTVTAPTNQVLVAGGACDIYFKATAWTSGTATCQVYY